MAVMAGMELVFDELWNVRRFLYLLVAVIAACYREVPLSAQVHTVAKFHQ
jgi:hypothetical protein